MQDNDSQVSFITSGFILESFQLVLEIEIKYSL